MKFSTCHDSTAVVTSAKFHYGKLHRRLDKWEIFSVYFFTVYQLSEIMLRYAYRLQYP